MLPFLAPSDSPHPVGVSAGGFLVTGTPPVEKDDGNGELVLVLGDQAGDHEDGDLPLLLWDEQDPIEPSPLPGTLPAPSHGELVLVLGDQAGDHEDGDLPLLLWDEQDPIEPSPLPGTLPAPSPDTLPEGWPPRWTVRPRVGTLGQGRTRGRWSSSP